MVLEPITPEEALDRAFWSVKAPSLGAMVGPWLGYAVLGEFGVVPTYGFAGLVWFLPIFLAGFVAGWLVWSVQVPRWRLWAYARVESIQELKEMAVSSQLIWPEGHFFEKTEIAPRWLRDELRALEEADRKRHAGGD